MSPTVRAAGLVIASLFFAASCGSCGTSTSASIVGYWTFKGGVVQVKQDGSAYQGVIVRRPESGACAEPIGYVLLKLSGSGNHYTGSEEWWEEPSCDRLYSNTAVIDVSGATAHLCSKDPFPGGGESECVDMQRLNSLPSSS
jgi:hypothetical protein